MSVGVCQVCSQVLPFFAQLCCKKVEPRRTSALLGYVSALAQVTGRHPTTCPVGPPSLPLTLVCVQVDGARAEQAADALPAIEGVTDVDVDALEASLLAQQNQTVRCGRPSVYSLFLLPLPPATPSAHYSCCPFRCPQQSLRRLRVRCHQILCQR